MTSGKRIFDVCIAVLVILLFSPIMIAIALIVRIKHGSPILFCQMRPGLNGMPFHLIKFRTMTNNQDPKGNLLPDAQRITSFGKFLRYTSLDELPELINVLKGEMSLVGPRPLLIEYLPLYTLEQARRHDVRPGITGWAQVNGRNSINWEEKFKMDMWYIDNWSFILDLKILWMTLVIVLKREGINQKGKATIDKFSGSIS